MLNESVKKVTKYLIDFGEEVDRSLADGWQWKDALNFTDELFATPGFVKEVPAALSVVKAGLSDEDREELNQFVKSEFDISRDDAEEKIEGAITWMLATDKFIRLFKKKSPVV